ncbi:MAG: hypothetical protein QXL94_06045 [Candidatus Parvarchaeum sp.]
MESSIEKLLEELDNKLESVKDENTAKIVNYIEISPEAKLGFIEYLIKDYQMNEINTNNTPIKPNLRKYAYIPFGVAFGSIAAFYSLQHGLSVFDLLATMTITYVSAGISHHFAAKKRDEYFSDVIMSEILRPNLKDKILDFYNNLGKALKNENL